MVQLPHKPKLRLGYHTDGSLSRSVFSKCNIKNRKLKKGAKAGPWHPELHVLVMVDRSVEGYRDVKPEEVAHGIHGYLVSRRFPRLLVPYGHQADNGADEQPQAYST
jgi:hypothetical protein